MGHRHKIPFAVAIISHIVLQKSSANEAFQLTAMRFHLKILTFNEIFVNQKNKKGFEPTSKEAGFQY